jgi:WhiB family redox-sensing transcriptional regulator
MAWMSPGSGEQLPALEDVLRWPGWMELAACAGMPLETFFPARGQTAAAGRAVCSTCNVRPECLDYARMDSDMAGGGEGPRNANGGTTERWRKRGTRQIRVIDPFFGPQSALRPGTNATEAGACKAPYPGSNPGAASKGLGQVGGVRCISDFGDHPPP